MTELTGPDEFPLASGHPRAVAHQQISALLEEAPAHIERITELMRGRSLLRAEPELAVSILIAAVERCAHLHADGGELSTRRRYQRARILDLIGRLAPLELPHDDETMTRLLRHGATLTAGDDLGSRPSLILASFRSYAKQAGLDPEELARRPALTEAAHALLETLRGRAAEDHREIRHYRELRELLGVDADRVLAPGEVWADAVLAELAAMDDDRRGAWTSLLAHCKDASASKPTKRWREQARALLDAIGPEEARAALVRWLPLVARGRRTALPPEERTYSVPDDMGYIVEDHQIVLRGLAWAASSLADAELARALSKLARASFRKLRGYGPRAPKVGNAAVWALGEMQGIDAVGQLAVLEGQLSGKSVKKQVGRALAAAAEREGVTREELEELAVPTHDLREVGRAVEIFGEVQAELMVVDSATVRLRWRDGSGKSSREGPAPAGAGMTSDKSRATVPKVVKTEFKAELKALRERVKEISALLAARRDRLELRYRDEQVWTYAKWKERYLDHPLVGSIARRLIWRLRSGERVADLLWRDGHLRDLGGEAQPSWIDADTQVSLWHPLDADAESLLVWRDRLEDAGVTQPFSQAHRETYAPDADERGAAISTRFAGHILRQHQFNALCQRRGWANTLRLSVDDMYGPATLTFPRYDLRAEFWIEGVGRYGDDTTDVGTFLYVVSEQLRFHRLGDPPSRAHAIGGGYQPGADPVPFAEVPAFVFSEVMRDVDLFVSVSSAANDPTWDPRGLEGPLAHYWEDFAFGPLTATGRTRRAVLERVLATLAIADRCELGERSLRVRGSDERVYEIHLGTANVRDEDGQVRVLAARRGKADGPGLALPFEGDAKLAAIVTKAERLASDATRALEPGGAKR